MVKPLFLLAAFALAAAAPLPAKTMGNYTFTLDGKDYEPGTYCVEMGDLPVPGDVIQLGIIPVTLDEPGQYDLRWEVLEPLARFSLTHPRQANRWRTLEELRDLGGEPSRQFLRAVVRGEFKPRELPDEDVYEPEGSQTFYPNAIRLPDETSDALAAALCLMEVEDAASRTEVEKLKSAQPDALRSAFDKELAEYRNRQKRKN